MEEDPVHDHDKEQEKPAQDFGTFLNAIILPNSATSLNAMTSD